MIFILLISLFNFSHLDATWIQCHSHIYYEFELLFSQLINCDFQLDDLNEKSNFYPILGMSSLMSSSFAAMTPFTGQAYTQLTASAK